MRKIAVIIGILILVTNSYSVFAGESANPNCDEICREMQSINSLPNVVGIEVAGPKGLGQGSGFYTGFGGREIILTNFHVVNGALKVWVTDFPKGGAKQEVTVLGKDPLLDVAVLSVPAVVPEGVTPIKLGDSLEVGEMVYAIGYPNGLRSITTGRVNINSPKSWRFVMTQAPLNPGSSGSPLVNGTREVVGINTAISTGNGNGPVNIINLITPIWHIKRVLPRLLKEKLLKHASAGFGFYNANDIPAFVIEQLGIEGKKDVVVVTSVEKNSPADHAGIKEGDILLAFNNFPVTSAGELEQKIFFDHRPDEELVFTFQRGTQKIERKLRLIDPS